MVPEISALPSNMQNKIAVSERGCWEWTGALNSRNYGCIAVTGVSQLAHRVAYTLLVGPIPGGLEIDHLCRNTVCCNPSHLEPVTQYQNVHRRPDIRKTHCIRGHAMTPENIIMKYRGTHEMWNCRECTNAAARRRRAERSQPAA